MNCTPGGVGSVHISSYRPSGVNWKIQLRIGETTDAERREIAGQDVRVESEI